MRALKKTRYVNLADLAVFAAKGIASGKQNIRLKASAERIHVFLNFMVNS